MSWHFIPMTVQYLAGAAISLAVTIFVFKRNPKNIPSTFFLSYGLITTVWMISVFLARNAPSESIAFFFYRIIMFCFTISFPLLLLTLLSIKQFNKLVLLTFVPGLLWGIAMALGNMVQVSWSIHGWSYAIVGLGTKIGYPVNLGYLLGVVVAGLILIKQSPSRSIAKKYKIIIAGCLVYFIPLIVTNAILWRYPWFFPIGGILLTIEFLFIAYAISLPAQTITLKAPLSLLAEHYANFINRVQGEIPGKELGESNFKFQDYIEAMGLRNCITGEDGKTEFNQDHLTEEVIYTTPESIIRLMKLHRWIITAAPDFTLVLATTYTTLSAKSTVRSKRWLTTLFEDHYGFLSKYDMLAGLPVEQNLPTEVTAIEPGKTYLIEEATPQKAYGILQQGLGFAMHALCISKLSPDALNATYGIEDADVICLNFEHSNADGNHQDISELLAKASAAMQDPNLVVVLLDCFDQVKFANGLAKSIRMLKAFQETARSSRCTLIVSIPPASFDKKELELFRDEVHPSMVQL